MNDYATSAAMPQLNWLVKPNPGIKFHQQIIGLPETTTGSFGSVLPEHYWREVPMQSISGFDVSNGAETTLKYIISQGVKIRDFGKVLGYLRTYSGLIDALLFAFELTKAILGQTDELELSLYQDPEDSSCYLYLEILKEQYPGDFYDFIEPVRSQYRPMLRGQKGWLLVSTDFRSPTQS